MLINKTAFIKTQKKVYIMSNVEIERAHVIKELREIALKVKLLASGLQNVAVAPQDKAGLPNKSIDYLTKASEAIFSFAQEIEEQTAQNDTGFKKNTSGIANSPP